MHRCVASLCESALASRWTSKPPESQEAFEIGYAKLLNLCSARVGQKCAYQQLFSTDASTPV